MINYRYQLVSPRKILAKPVEEDFKHKVIVKPLILSICAADQRYFQGTRDYEILKKKLPMSLIHEGVGQIVYDETKQFNVGDLVVILPNISRSEKNENYDTNSKFMSSSLDGFMQENIILDSKQLLKYENIPNEIAVFAELLSVAIHAIESSNKEIKKSKIIGIWGDGNLGYLLHLYLSFKFPKKKIFIFGTNNDKLECFSFATKKINIYNNDKIPSVDFAFESVGGIKSEKAINQIISSINPTSTICLLGVSENLPQINTRLILEKGLKIIGRSRSTKKDFENAIKFLSLTTYHIEIKKIISKVFCINDLNDILTAFDYDYINSWKTLLKWNL